MSKPPRFYYPVDYYIQTPKSARLLFVLSAFIPLIIAHILLMHPTLSNLHLTNSITGVGFFFACILSTFYLLSRFTPATFMIQMGILLPAMVIIGIQTSFLVSLIVILGFLGLMVTATFLVALHHNKLNNLASALPIPNE